MLDYGSVDYWEVIVLRRDLRISSGGMYTFGDVVQVLGGYVW